MVGILVSFWDGLFSGAIAVSFREGTEGTSLKTLCSFNLYHFFGVNGLLGGGFYFYPDPWGFHDPY